MVGTIYCIENKSNGKKYIGQTIQSLDQRHREHKRNSKYRRSKNYYFYNAVRKYGFGNFAIYAVEENIPFSMLDKKECEYIEKFDTVKNGYNISRGGSSGKRKLLPINEIIDLYSQGFTLKEIGKRYGCDKSVVSNRLKSAGIPIRDWNSMQRVDVSEEDLRRLYIGRFMTTPEIAAVFKTSHQTILKKLKMYNISTRPSINRKYLSPQTMPRFAEM